MNFDGLKESRQFDQIQNQYDSMSHSVVFILLKDQNKGKYR